MAEIGASQTRQYYGQQMSIRGFRQSCRYHFRFLTDQFGYQEERLPNRPEIEECQVRFTNQKVRWIIEGVHYATRAKVWVAKYAEILDMPQPPELSEWLSFRQNLEKACFRYGPAWSLDDILQHVYHIDVVANQKAGRSTWRYKLSQYQQLQWYSEAIQSHCLTILRGDISKFQRNRKIGKYYCG